MLSAWHLGSGLLAQVDIFSDPMSYNAAIGFVLLGLAMAVQSYPDRRSVWGSRLVFWIALAIMTMALITLIQYCLQSDLAIDWLFFSYGRGDSASLQNHMAAITALCFILATSALMLMCRAKRKPVNRILSVTLASAVAGFGIVGLLGFVGRFTAFFAWGDSASMSVYSAFGFCLVSAQLMLNLRQRETPSLHPINRLFIFIAPGLLVMLALVFNRNMAPITGSFVIFSLLCAWLLVQLRAIDRQRRTIYSLYHQKISAFNAMLDGLVVIDPHGIILDTNKALCRMFGFDREELIGQSIKKVIPPPISNEHDNFLLHSKHTRKGSIVGSKRTLPARKKNGLQFPITLQVTEYQHDGKDYYTGVIHDLTAITYYENQAAEKESILKAAMDSSSAGMAIVNLDGRFMEVNMALAGWLGYTPSDLIQRRYLYIIPESQRQIVTKHFSQLVSGTHISINGEWLYRHKNGHFLWGHLSATVVKNALGEPQCFVGQIIDIDRQKNLELGLAKRNKELEASNAELQQFAYAASHDLKEPIRTLKTFSRFLIEDIKSNREEKIWEDIYFITDACERMTQLINGLLDLSHAGSSTYCYAECNLTNCVSTVVSQLAAQIESTKSQIVVIGALPCVEGDEVQLARVFQNLISNAIKFQKKNVFPRIEIYPVENPDKSMVSIAVKDNGIGIPENSFDSIFSIFKTLNHKNEYAGNGIGLSIVNKILQRHGGEISVDSKLGVGSLFTLTLPLKQGSFSGKS